MLSDAGMDTTLWARRPELAKAIAATGSNPDYLPDVELPPTLRATADAAEALAGARFVVIAVPSQVLRPNLMGWRELIPADALLVSLMKGVELGSTLRMSQVIAEVTGVSDERILVVSGPNLSREIARRQPAASVVACVDEDNARELQAACTTSYFRPYTQTDVIGCELGGAVKNVIAIAVGMADGMGLGDNAAASLITRGLAEIARLGAVLGADATTFSGLAGLGDLVATCSSPYSRNRTVGEQLGRGGVLTEIEAALHMVAEGVTSSRSILDLADKHGVEMPITEHVVAVVHEGMAPSEMVRRLMSREAKSERHGQGDR
ncbi:MAG: glycerol-3-phosphate dehydrogenase [Frankiales bacterium]|jgi:glycerol-3-phosphate dehydrogenase (NAD(P)+)|nr:glycerol-3-phosphate dehydrogenase [Frankiales bacterium]